MEIAQRALKLWRHVSECKPIQCTHAHNGRINKGPTRSFCGFSPAICLWGSALIGLRARARLSPSTSDDFLAEMSWRGEIIRRRRGAAVTGGNGRACGAERSLFVALACRRLRASRVPMTSGSDVRKRARDTRHLLVQYCSSAAWQPPLGR